MGNSTKRPPDCQTTDLRNLALSYLAGGVSLVPCGAKTKQPDSNLLPRGEDGGATWKPYQTEPATPATVDGWFRRGCQSVAAVGGKVSGGLLILDFDEEAERFYPTWCKNVGSLADGLPVQRTGGGGYQVYLRCDEPGKNDKLAYVPDETKEDGRAIAIETRGEGGYAVMPGSLHPTGRRYEAISGDFAAIPAVPQAVADALIAVARKLDEAPLTRKQMEARQQAAETSNRHRAESNGQASVIDEYNNRVFIQDELRQRGYEQHGDRWKRPGGKSLSVYVNEGRSFHHSSNDPLSDGYYHRPFDVFCELEHGGDCKAAVKAAAELLGMTLSDTPPDTTHQAGGDTSKPIEFRRISCAELDAATYDLEYLIDGALVAGQPCILAGGKKTLKTSLLIDLGISLAVGGCFLGRLKVNRAARVGVMTGESGLATIQETARRIATAAGHRLADIGGLVFSDQLPQFASPAHMEALRRFLMNDELEVIIIDPAYLCVGEADHGNLFAMGERLQGIARACGETGATLILAHHNRKTGKADPFSAPELEDIAWSGFQEFARQWLLVGRREPYEPGSGEHRLWLSAGGSAGHSDLWAVDIAEGTRKTEGGRFWQVNVMPATEARQSADTRQAEAKQKRTAERRAAELESDRAAIVKIMGKLNGPETKTVIRDRVEFGKERFGRAFASLTEDGTIRPVELKKGRGTHSYEAWRLKKDDET